MYTLLHRRKAYIDITNIVISCCCCFFQKECLQLLCRWGSVPRYGMCVPLGKPSGVGMSFMFKIKHQQPDSLDLQAMPEQFQKNLIYIFLKTAQNIFLTGCDYDICTAGLFHRSSDVSSQFYYFGLQLTSRGSCSVERLLDTMNALRGQELELNTGLGSLNSYQLSVELYNGQLMLNEVIVQHQLNTVVCLNEVNVQFKMMEICPMVELSRDALSLSKLPNHVIESIFSNRIPASYVADEAEQNQTFTVCFSNYMSVIQSNNVSSSRDCVYVAFLVFAACIVF